MSEEFEKGFLADKFGDWSSEPIPNGWERINSIIETDRKNPGRKPVWLIITALLLFSGLASYWVRQQQLMNPEGLVAVENNLELSKNESPKGIDKNLSREVRSTALPSSQTKKIGSGWNDNHKPADIPPGPKVQLEGNPLSETRIAPVDNRVSLTTRLAFHNSKSIENEDETVSLLDDKSGYNKKENLISPTQPVGSIKAALADTHLSALNSAEEGEFSNSHQEAGSLIDQSIQLTPLDIRLSLLQIPANEYHPIVRPMTLDPDFPLTNNSKKFFWYAGVCGGYAPRSIEINQAETVRKLRVADAGSGLQSGFANISIMVQNEIKPWIRSFVSLKLGLLQHSIHLTEISKEPIGFQMSTTDSVNYTMVPLYSNASGSYRQDIFFGNVEFGLNPILFSSRASGPFASVVIWASLKQSVSSSLQGADAGWENSSENVALSYRLGYAHTFSGKWKAEIFTAGLPDKILANSKGLSIKPQLFGFGIHYQIR